MGGQTHLNSIFPYVLIQIYFLNSTPSHPMMAAVILQKQPLFVTHIHTVHFIRKPVHVILNNQPILVAA